MSVSSRQEDLVYRPQATFHAHSECKLPNGIQNTMMPALTQILNFSPSVPLAAPPTQPITDEPSAPQVASSKQLTRILRKEKRKNTVSDASDLDTSSLHRNKRLLKKQKKSTTS